MSTYFELNKVAKEQMKLTYRNRGGRYSTEESIIRHSITESKKTIEVEADIQGTRKYKTHFTITTIGKHNAEISDWDCSCPAFGPNIACKHIAGLIKFTSKEYAIDKHFSLPKKNRTNLIGDPEEEEEEEEEEDRNIDITKPIKKTKNRNNENYYDEREDDDQLFWDEEEEGTSIDTQIAELESAIQHQIIPISKVDFFEEILGRHINEFDIVDDDEFQKIIYGADKGSLNKNSKEKIGLELLKGIKKITPIQITPSLQSTINNSTQNILKIKLNFNKQKNDIEIGLFKSKILKNGNLSAGQEIKENNTTLTTEPLFQILAPFIDQGGHGYYSYHNKRETLNSDSTYFIKTLLHCVDEKYIIQEHYSNEDILIKNQIGLIFIEIKKHENTFTISGLIKFSDGKKYKIKDHEPYGKDKEFIMLTNHDKSKLFFLKTRELPLYLIQALCQEDIILNTQEFQDFTKTKTFENLLGYCDTIDEKIIKSSHYQKQIITQNTPREVFLVEFDDQFKQIHITLKFRYPQEKNTKDPTISNNLNIYISPEDSRNYIDTIDGKIIERNKKKEKETIKNYLPLFMDHFNVEHPHQTSFHTHIDENTEKLFDRIDQLISKGTLIHYLQKTKKISTKSISVSVNIKSGIDRFDTQVKMKLGDEEIEDKSLLFKALQTGKKSIQLQNGTTILLKQDLNDMTKKLSELGIDENNINENKQISKYNIGTLGKMIDDVEKAKNKIKNTESKTTTQTMTLEISKEIIKLKKSLKNFSGLQKIKIPEQLNAELRNYQETGYHRLCFLKKYNFGGILADDMGLGKTIQTITLLLREYIDKKVKTPSIVICPTSLTYNRLEELKKFSPKLKTYRINDGNEGFTKIPKNTNIIIISYGIIANLINIGINKKFHYVILDESQHIKNPNTKRAKNIFKINGKYKLALSGTPIENNLLELRSIFNFLMPGFLNTQKEFTNKYIKNINNLPLLSAKIKPFILRRTKEKVLKDLPPKVEKIIYLSMENKQEVFYKKLAKIYKTNINKKLQEQGLNKARFEILDALLKLRQVCLMPSLVKIEGNNITDSIKLKYIEENIEDMIGKGHNLLLFSQFTGFLKYVKEILDQKQIKYNYLDGQTRPKQRQELVKSFNQGKVNVFIISLKAGGTGLNLTRADYVIHLDPRRNPAVERQATDRAHRIGQQKTVFVQKLIIKNSIEEKILKLQEKKKKLVDDILSGDFSGQLNEDDIKSIFD